MVECVQDSLTLKDIQVEYGGLGRFLQKHNSEQKQLEVQDTYIKSCGTRCFLFCSTLFCFFNTYSSRQTIAICAIVKCLY